jgi:hypothetical protein
MVEKLRYNKRESVGKTNRKNDSGKGAIRGAIKKYLRAGVIGLTLTLGAAGLAGCAGKNSDVKTAKDTRGKVVIEDVEEDPVTKKKEDKEEGYQELKEETKPIKRKVMVGIAAVAVMPPHKAHKMGHTSNLEKYKAPKLKLAKKTKAHKLITCEFRGGKCVEKAGEGDIFLETALVAFEQTPFEAAGVHAIAVKKVDKDGVELNVHMKGNASEPVLVKVEYGKAKKIGKDQKLTIIVKKTKKDDEVRVIIKQPKGYKKEEPGLAVAKPVKAMQMKKKEIKPLLFKKVPYDYGEAKHKVVPEIVEPGSKLKPKKVKPSFKSLPMDYGKMEHKTVPEKKN